MIDFMQLFLQSILATPLNNIYIYICTICVCIHPDKVYRFGRSCEAAACLISSGYAGNSNDDCFGSYHPIN